MQQKGFLKEGQVHRARLPRHDFDMSQDFGFTCSTGMILPVYQDFLNAGDSVYYSGSMLSRANPIIRQAMVDVDFYVDWFFVPMTMVLNTWQNIRWMTRDFLSSGYDNTQRSFFDGSLPLYDIYGFNCCYNSTLNRWSPSNNLGTYTSWLFDCQGKGRFRLLNHLGFNPYVVFGDNEINPDYDDGNLPFRLSPNVFPQFALAYQAIWHDYFRIDDRTPRNVAQFNADKYYINSMTGPLEPEDIADPFVLQYRPYKDDYFTSNHTSPILSSMNLIGGFDSATNTPAKVLAQINNYLGLDYTPSPGNSDKLGTYTSGAGDTGGELINYRYDIQQANAKLSSITTANMRSMFAVEKLARITGKAAKNYDAQMLAHFGIKVPHDVKHELTHLGTDKALLHIGQVVSTADTFDGESGSALGTQSGQGYVTLSGKKRKFEAPVDGIIMGVVSSVPKKYYYGTFDKQNSVTNRLDYFVPEFDRLGAQPLFSYECDSNFIGTSLRVGWQYRYNQYKRKYNRVTEAFKLPLRDDSVNAYSAWVNGSQPLKQNAYYQIPDDNGYYCTPHELDNIMVVPYVSEWSDAYNTTPWLMFGTDPFVCHFAADVKKVSVMSPTGEPQLD